MFAHFTLHTIFTLVESFLHGCTCHANHVPAAHLCYTCFALPALHAISRGHQCMWHAIPIHVFHNQNCLVKVRLIRKSFFPEICFYCVLKKEDMTLTTHLLPAHTSRASINYTTSSSWTYANRNKTRPLATQNPTCLRLPLSPWLFSSASCEVYDSQCVNCATVNCSQFFTLSSNLFFCHIRKSAVRCWWVEACL